MVEVSCFMEFAKFIVCCFLRDDKLRDSENLNAITVPSCQHQPGGRPIRADSLLLTVEQSQEGRVRKTSCRRL